MDYICINDECRSDDMQVNYRTEEMTCPFCGWKRPFTPEEQDEIREAENEGNRND